MINQAASSAERLTFLLEHLAVMWSRLTHLPAAAWIAAWNRSTTIWSVLALDHVAGRGDLSS